MGMHSLLTSELESTDTFRGSMVIGYYHGTPIFIEPMLTRSLLLEKRSFDLRSTAGLSVCVFRLCAGRVALQRATSARQLVSGDSL
jgi:hypothetical protein